MKRAKIKANREKWVAFLQEPERKKATGILARGDTEHRCCLGHACQALDPSRVTGWAGRQELPPMEIAEMLALKSEDGGIIQGEQYRLITFENSSSTTLAMLNDNTKARPQDIGKMLAGMIEGGTGTPFHPLTDYPE